METVQTGLCGSSYTGSDSSQCLEQTPSSASLSLPQGFIIVIVVFAGAVLICSLLVFPPRQTATRVHTCPHVSTLFECSFLFLAQPSRARARAEVRAAKSMLTLPVSSNLQTGDRNQQDTSEGWRAGPRLASGPLQRSRAQRSGVPHSLQVARTHTSASTPTHTERWLFSQRLIRRFWHLFASISASHKDAARGHKRPLELSSNSDNVEKSSDSCFLLGPHLHFRLFTNSTI